MFILRMIRFGYRVNSHRIIEFRKWTTEILRKYIIKDFECTDEEKRISEDFYRIK